MSSYIHHIETLVPKAAFNQSAFSQVQDRLLKDTHLKRYAKSIYQDSGIFKRHSVVVEPGNNVSSSFYSLGKDRAPYEPSTGERNRIFGEEAARLGSDVSAAALTSSSFLPSQITHLITFSCTGFTNPGPDLAIIKKLGLSNSVERYNLGFMGCYAAFPALRMADQFCQANPRAVILIVGIELCSLHFQFKETLDTVLANSLFSDGASAVLVHAKKPAPPNQALKIEGFSSTLIPHAINEMAWNVGDKGFDIVLSKYVPRIIGENITGLVETILKKHGFNPEDIGHWAIHPGGKSILDKFQKSVNLGESDLKESREVLRDFGNMSAVTVLFVLQKILENKRNGEKPIFAAAFGPGLTVESAIFSTAHATTEQKFYDQYLYATTKA